MIRTIIDILNLDDFYGKSEIVDIAKGKYKYPDTVEEFKKVIVRKWRSKK